MYLIILQHSIRHAAGYQAGKVDATKKLILIGLLGEQPFKLPRTGDPLAEQVDGQTLGLTGLAEDEQVVSRQQRNGDQLNQLFTLRHLTVDILHYGQHFISQCHTLHPPYAAASASSWRYRSGASREMNSFPQKSAGA